MFLTAREVDDLASWSAEPRLILFAALTGLRLGEILALRDTEIDLDAKGPSWSFGPPARASRAERRRGRSDECTSARLPCKRSASKLLARRPTPTGLLFPSPPSARVWNSDNFRADGLHEGCESGGSEGCTRPARRARPTRIPRPSPHVRIAHGRSGGQSASDRRSAWSLRQDGSARPNARWKRYGHLYPGSTREAIAALDRHLEARGG